MKQHSAFPVLEKRDRMLVSAMETTWFWSNCEGSFETETDSNHIVTQEHVFYTIR
jgi:hypothetical protein